MLAIVLLVLVGCEGIFTPADPLSLTGERPATADQVAYATAHYESVERCLDVTGNVNRVVWRTAVSITLDGRPLTGANRAHNIWVRADKAQVRRLEDGRLAGYPYDWRHEAMHHVLWTGTGDGDTDHRNELWPRCAPESVLSGYGPGPEDEGIDQEPY